MAMQSKDYFGLVRAADRFRATWEEKKWPADEQEITEALLQASRDLKFMQDSPLKDARAFVAQGGANLSVRKTWVIQCIDCDVDQAGLAINQFRDVCNVLDDRAFSDWARVGRELSQQGQMRVSAGVRSIDRDVGRLCPGAIGTSLDPERFRPTYLDVKRVEVSIDKITDRIAEEVCFQRGGGQRS